VVGDQLPDFILAQMALASIGANPGRKKVSNFQGPPLPMALVMDLPTSKALRPAPYKQQVH
jgi:hypothetical protein